MKQQWNPATRQRPTSAWADIYPAMWSAMANGRQPMTHEDYQTMTAYFRLAFLNIQQGSASEETWNCLALGANMALILAENGIGEEYIPKIQAAQGSLMRAKGRAATTGSLRLDGAGLAAMRELLDVYEGQLEIATRNEILAARDTVQERLDRQVAEGVCW